MRTRFAVLSLLSLAVASIAWPPPTSAAPPEATAQAQGEPVDPSALIVDFAKTPAYYIVIKAPVVIRLTQAVDSSGHPVLVVEGRRLPNPAEFQTSGKGRAQRYTDASAAMQGPVAQADSSCAGLTDRHANVLGLLHFWFCPETPPPLGFPLSTERFRPGLRAAATTGTLFSTGRIRS